MPSRWLLCTCATGALIGISWKFGPPRREICVSTYEWMRPASSGSFEKSMPGTMCAAQNATCSVSAKKLSGLRFSTMLADRRQRHQLLGHDLGRIEDVEAEALGLLLGEHLDAELVLGERAGLDRLPQVAAMEVGIGAGDLHRLVPVERVRAGDRVPVELHEARLALGVDEAEGVHAEALHHAVAARNRAVGHHPHQHVRRLRHQRDEVPERVVRGRRLRHARSAARASPRGPGPGTSSRPG